jgi:raffinose/stachyose/melibiose transport system permease protein
MKPASPAAASTATVDAAASPAQPAQRATHRRRVRKSTLVAYLLVLPAAVFYAIFVVRPIVLTGQYSLYDWDGINPATWTGFSNYIEVFTNPTLIATILNAFELIIYFSFVPVILGLFAANVIRSIATSRLAVVARTVLFLPQIIPLVAAGIMWTWQLSTKGMVNQLLSAIGLGDFARAWLGDTQTALPAVGVIGAWVQLGLCLLLLLAGMTKIEPALYEAARIDGAGPIREFFSITLPSLRQEIAVCVIITVISALASFDIIYISTQGGPANSTLVPGLQIYYMAFFRQDIGTASALAVVLMVLVLLVVLPIQRILRGRDA